jgi:hypothetical protein
MSEGELFVRGGGRAKESASLREALFEPLAKQSVLLPGKTVAGGEREGTMVGREDIHVFLALKVSGGTGGRRHALAG